MTNFELGARVPLMLSAPQLPEAARGAYVGQGAALAELLDVYPTLVDIAGLALPNNTGAVTPPQGKSLLPVMMAARRDENHAAVGFTGDQGASSSAAMAAAATGLPFDIAFSQMSRKGGKGSIMGLSMRTTRWRYTEWSDFDETNGWPKYFVNSSVALAAGQVELYDHAGDDGTDMDGYENENVATDPANAALVQQLGAQLRMRWDGGALPPAWPPALPDASA